MDGFSFDRLVRRISEEGSRRGLLRSALVAAAGGLGLTMLLGAEEAEAKSCKAKCNKKKDNKAKKKCKKKCQKQTSTAPVGSKQAGQVCENTAECAPPLSCADPLISPSGGDKKCCGQTNAPCGGDDANGDDLQPGCCQGFICSTDGLKTSTPGTCRAA